MFYSFWMIIFLYLSCGCMVTPMENNKMTDCIHSVEHMPTNSGDYCQYEEFNLVILHTNDMHSRVLETSMTSVPICRTDVCYGGFARVKLVAKQIKENYEKLNYSVLFLNAGDNFQGSPFYSFFKWEVLRNLIPNIGFDVMSLGNHEFDDGEEQLASYLYNLETPVVGCNINFSKNRFFKNITILPSKVFDFKGITVGVVGYLTPESKLGGANNITIFDEIESIREEVGRLKASNVDVIISLGHSGFEMDKRIAREIPGVDLVVGGHSHSFLWNGTNPPSSEKIVGQYPTWIEQISEFEGKQSIKKVPVVQAYAYTKYLGFLKLNFEINKQSKLIKNIRKLQLTSAEGNPILLTSSEFDEDIELRNKILKWKTDVEKLTSKRIGETLLFLEGDASICRHRECNLGNLIADSFVDYSVRQYSNSSMIPISFVHSGSIRANIDSPNGLIFYGDVISVLPFSNQLVKIKLKGKHLRETFEHSVSAIEYNLGRFLQVSGLKIKYDIRRPVGKRVVSIKARCQFCQSRLKPINDDNDYEVVTLKELVEGVDSYTNLKSQATIIRNFAITDLDVLIQYLENHSPVFPEIEGRITFLS